MTHFIFVKSCHRAIHGYKFMVKFMFSKKREKLKTLARHTIIFCVLAVN